MKRAAVILSALAIFAASGAIAADLAPLSVPAKILPPPTADISREMQEIIAAQPHPAPSPATAEEGRAAADKAAAIAVQRIPDMLQRLGVTMTAATIDGVRVHVITPNAIPAKNKDKLLIHVHGGCYMLSPGESGTIEGILMAGIGGYQVISVDYRMPPEAYFPAALDDGITVYRAALKSHAPKKLAIFGTSAGGALTLEMILKARELGLPMPGAIAPGTPMADITKTGDSFYTNEGVDNVLVSRNGFCDADAMIYAHGHDPHDPLLSPVYGDMHGFPPAILTTGTRDLLLSNTVRVHRKLRRAGVEAELNVYEGESHAQYGRDDRIAETREAFGDIAAFFARHLR